MSVRKKQDQMSLDFAQLDMLFAKCQNSKWRVKKLQKFMTFWGWKRITTLMGGQSLF